MLWSQINTIIDDIADTDSNEFPTATRIIYANAAQAELSGDILALDGDWQWDDPNYVSHAIARADLADGDTYVTFDETILMIEGVSVKDINGNHQKLTYKDKREFGMDPEEFMKTPGLPIYYDKAGPSVFFSPAVSSSQVATGAGTKGLKVYFARIAKEITSFDSSSPAIPSTAHMILPYKIALPYLIKYKPELVKNAREEIERLHKVMLTTVSMRSKDEPNRLIANVESNK